MKPNPVKTHLRNAIIVPEMVGAIVGVYSGKAFTNVEIKFDMIGRYLGEFSMTYKLTRHGKPGVGASKGSANQWSIYFRIVVINIIYHFNYGVRESIIQSDLYFSIISSEYSTILISVETIFSPVQSIPLDFINTAETYSE